MTCPFYIIVACDENNGIGAKNSIPWELKGEMRHFKEVTSKTDDEAKQNIVIMGRSTWESLPEKFRPLPGRLNFVLSSNLQYHAEGAEVFSSLEESLTAAQSLVEAQKAEKVFVIGGQKVYEQAISHSNLAGIYLTKIKSTFDCDAFFPAVPNHLLSNAKLLGSETEENLNYEKWLMQN